MQRCCKCDKVLWNLAFQITKWGWLKDSKWAQQKIKSSWGLKFFWPLKWHEQQHWGPLEKWFGRVDFTKPSHIYSTVALVVLWNTLSTLFEAFFSFWSIFTPPPSFVPYLNCTGYCISGYSLWEDRGGLVLIKTTFGSQIRDSPLGGGGGVSCPFDRLQTTQSQFQLGSQIVKISYLWPTSPHLWATSPPLWATSPPLWAMSPPLWATYVATLMSYVVVVVPMFVCLCHNENLCISSCTKFYVCGKHTSSLRCVGLQWYFVEEKEKKLPIFIQPWLLVVF